MTRPVRLPDAASLESMLAGLDPASADAALLRTLKTQCVRLPHPDARVLRRWADRSYGF